MGFAIIWSDKASAQLEKLPHPIRKVIFSKVSELAASPYTGAVKKLRGIGGFRLRVGDYRVVFDIEKKDLRITVLFLGHRKNIYKRLGLQ